MNLYIERVDVTRYSADSLILNQTLLIIYPPSMWSYYLWVIIYPSNKGRDE